MESNNNMKGSRRRVAPHLQYTRGIDVQNVMLQGMTKLEFSSLLHQFLMIFYNFFPYFPSIYFIALRHFRFKRISYLFMILKPI